MNTSRNIAKWFAIFEEDTVFVVHGEGSCCCLMEKDTCSISKANQQVDSGGHFCECCSSLPKVSSDWLIANSSVFIISIYVSL